MEVKVTYPIGKKKNYFWNMFCKIISILFVVAAFVCVLINLATRGNQWSIVVILGEFLIWASFISPSIYNLNRISQFIKLLIWILILLIGIEIFLYGGWALFVVPIVSFGGLTLIGILFFSDFQRQKSQSISFLFLIIICLIFGFVGIFAPLADQKWVYITLASVSLAWLIVCIATLKNSIILDLKKKFNIN